MALSLQWWLRARGLARKIHQIEAVAMRLLTCFDQIAQVLLLELVKAVRSLLHIPTPEYAPVRVSRSHRRALGRHGLQ